MEAGSRRGEESRGEEGAQEGGWLGRLVEPGGVREGGGLGGLEGGEEGVGGNSVGFKWAVIDGPGGEGSVLGASQGRGGGT